jgi:uncharacterized protein
MRWTDLAFLHWPVSAASLRPFVPLGLELDRFDGRAWLGIVPFRMEGVRHRWLPPVPTTTTFLEINVRTYVTGGGRPGVWFFSLDAESWLAVCGARLGLNLPYFHARMRASRQSGSVMYESRRLGSSRPPADFAAHYAPIGGTYRADPGTLEHWLTERYCLFGETRAGRLYFLNIHHLPWPLQRAEAAITQNGLATRLDIDALRGEPLCHFAERLDVVGWARDWLE